MLAVAVTVDRKRGRVVQRAQPRSYGNPAWAVTGKADQRDVRSREKFIWAQQLLCIDTFFSSSPRNDGLSDDFSPHSGRLASGRNYTSFCTLTTMCNLKQIKYTPGTQDCTDGATATPPQQNQQQGFCSPSPRPLPSPPSQFFLPACNMCHAYPIEPQLAFFRFISASKTCVRKKYN